MGHRDPTTNPRNNAVQVNSPSRGHPIDKIISVARATGMTEGCARRRAGSPQRGVLAAALAAGPSASAFAKVVSWLLAFLSDHRISPSYSAHSRDSLADVA
jgi:hypothetical protein